MLSIKALKSLRRCTYFEPETVRPIIDQAIKTQAAWDLAMALTKETNGKHCIVVRNLLRNFKTIANDEIIKDHQKKYKLDTKEHYRFGPSCKPKPKKPIDYEALDMAQRIRKISLLK